MFRLPSQVLHAKRAEPTLVVQLDARQRRTSQIRRREDATVDRAPRQWLARFSVAEQLRNEVGVGLDHVSANGESGVRASFGGDALHDLRWQVEARQHI